MRYLMMNKPRGYVCAMSDERRAYVAQLLTEDARRGLFPVGRLDMMTEGLLLFTDDGEFCYKILHPDTRVEKTYFFYALGELDDAKISLLEKGVKIYNTRDFITSEAKVACDGVTTLEGVREYIPQRYLSLLRRHPDMCVSYGRVTVTEGKKHQVRRMLRHVGLVDLYLKRISIAGLTLDGSLQAGEYRELTNDEISSLMREICK